jgi:hypothetical protein
MPIRPSCPYLALLILPVLLTGCGHHDGPRADILPRADAVNDHRVMRMRILRVFDNANNEYTTEFRVWHIIEVKVLDGPEEFKGKIVDLPFDDFLALHPPLVDDEVIAAPADWVTEKRAFNTYKVDQ